MVRVRRAAKKGRGVRKKIGVRKKGGGGGSTWRKLALSDDQRTGKQNEAEPRVDAIIRSEAIDISTDCPRTSVDLCSKEYMDIHRSEAIQHLYRILLCPSVCKIENDIRQLLFFRDLFT